MVHLTNTSRSATFLIGIGILMLFFFCAPTLAQSSQGFKSTSAYQINTSVQTSAVNADAAYQPYRSTVQSVWDAVHVTRRAAIMPFPF